MAQTFSRHGQRSMQLAAPAQMGYAIRGYFNRRASIRQTGQGLRRSQRQNAPAVPDEGVT